MSNRGHIGVEKASPNEGKRRKAADESDSTNLTHNSYTVGWVCALPKELTAATAMLDQIHPDLSAPSGDHNTYTLGSIEEHNVVIACLPIGTIGTVSAATVATQMIRTFPSIKVGLLVGIGGGIPPEVRLGDVVVGTPVDQYPGVVQWDMGKAEQDGFKRTGAMHPPPSLLRTATSKLVANHGLKEPKIYQYLKDLEEKWPQLVPKYTWSDSLNDSLYNTGSDSLNDPLYNTRSRLQVIFSMLWGIIMTLLRYLIGWSELAPINRGSKQMTDGTVKVESNRAQRKPGEIRIHYGLIASGNEVIKKAEIRDDINKMLGGNVLCFEMEAAGLMDFPCIVIRGICDYADSQKNNDWQEYAAMVAAAYARELLGYVQPSAVDTERPVKDILDQISDTLSEIRPNVAHMKSRLDKEEDFKILSWLTPVDYAPQHNDHCRRREPGTGQWLLESAQFETWAATKKQTLFCPGMPGAGKTMLTSIVINHLEEKFQADPAMEFKIGIAYIYCNFKQHDKQEIYDLLASLLKQLAACQSSLPKDVKELYDCHKDITTRPTLHEILRVFDSVTATFSRVFIVVDALDECPASNRRRFLEELFKLQRQHGVNIFATSRDIPEIVDQFKDSPQLEIRASNKDVVRYLENHMEQLLPFVQKDRQLQDKIKEEISEAVDGMFLLVPIYLGLLEDKTTTNDIRESLEGFRKQGQGHTRVLADAYEQAMERIKGQKSGLEKLAIRVLSWITCATRPLTISELQHALAIRVGKLKLDEGDMSHIEDMASVCLGLVTVDEESNIIRLVHYTTQEYFERTWEHWFPNAHTDITESSVTYLSFECFGTGVCKTYDELYQRSRSNVLYNYAAKNWVYHAGKSSIEGGSLILDFLQSTANVSACRQGMIFDPDKYQPYAFQTVTKFMGLHLAASSGLLKSTSTLLEKNVNIEALDGEHCTPLSLAARAGHDRVVKLLLEKNANIERSDIGYPSPLLLAAMKGHDAVVKLLLEKNANIESRDGYGRTPLSWAAEGGCDAVVKVLLEKNANIESGDPDALTPLSLAAGNGHETVVKLLLERNANVESRSRFNYTPLSLAAEMGHEAVVRLLLEKNANIESRNDNGQSPLSLAADAGFGGVVRLLLEKNANIESSNRTGWTPLLYAASKGHDAVVKLLLEENANVEARATFDDWTPLLRAAWLGSEEVVRLLLERNANIDCIYRHGETALSLAAKEGHEGVVKLLEEAKFSRMYLAKR
ncbi:hypothetical protein FQN51_008473 [Onygenales sp. PD_10]|nr:hypothetical protein FQN51_008473 [Onygenales sp. PD_10]